MVFLHSFLLHSEASVCEGRRGSVKWDWKIRERKESEVKVEKSKGVASSRLGNNWQFFLGGEPE